MNLQPSVKVRNDFKKQKNAYRYKYRPIKSKAISGVTYVDRATKVKTLFRVLREHEWTFRFCVEAVSPRGFSYIAEGSTTEEAFLKAFAMWRSEAIPGIKDEKVTLS